MEASEASIGVEREKLIAFLRDPDPAIRSLAANLLARIGAGRVAQAILPLLNDRHASVRLDATEALGHLCYTPAAEELARRLREDTSPLVRTSAAESLGYLGVRSPTVVAALLHAVSTDRSPLVRGYAANALARLGASEAGSEIRAQLARERSAWARASLLQALYRMGDTAALTALLGMLGRVKSPKLRSAILGMLDDLLTPQNEDEIYDAVGKLIQARPSLFEEQGRWWEEFKAKLL